MLTEEEKKLINKYYLYPKIGITALIMTFLLGGVWLVLVMIDDIGFKNRSFYLVGFFVYLLLAIALLAIFAFCFIVTKFGMSDKKWQEIVQKASAYQAELNYGAQIASAVGLGAAGRVMRNSQNNTVKNMGTAAGVAGGIATVATVAGMANKMNSNVKSVMDAFHLERPSGTKYVLMVMFLPILAMIAVYIPEYVHASSVKKAEIQTMCEAIEKVRDALEPTCTHIYSTDPTDDYGYQYYVMGYFDDKYEYYITVDIDSDGVIYAVNYHGDIDTEKSQEENMELVLESWAALHEAFSHTNAEVVSSAMLEVYQFPEEFIEEFNKGLYHEEISAYEDRDDGTRIEYDYVSYSYAGDNQYEDYLSLGIEMD